MAEAEVGPLGALHVRVPIHVLLPHLRVLDCLNLKPSILVSVLVSSRVVQKSGRCFM